MLEWLAVSTGVELSKLVLEQMLNLSKPILEGYVQDFFGNCLDSGVARLKFGTLKEPMAEAIGCFVKRFIEELQLNFVPETSIEHHYRGALKRFVQDKAVGQILGKAFETDCKQIDYAELERLWTEKYQDAAWQFPEEGFDWRGVAKKYVFEVKGIVRVNPELRALLETDLLETIAQNTAQVSPGFDIETYQESLSCSYGYLKLYTLDSTGRVDAIKLWNIFVEQTVREALPPTRYELPTDLKRKLKEEGQLEEDLSPEALEHYRREYFEQPARKVLEAVAESQRAMILGDPGSGKSSLLQYLALEWVEDKTEMLPLLIELREFAVSQCSNFLEFLHRGRGADWQFDQQQLHQHLLENPTLVMFDGLDEIFDRATQAAVVDDIVRFAQQYPQAKVLVTSRIIGYNPERLRHSKFRHFTIQSLDTDESHEFIDRWYDLSMGSDLDKERLKQRLKDAIENSKPIQNLADNPLLLTMMAILNRQQELPRDRADLYDQASRVLLHHWDVDHKRLQLPLEAIGRREKQEMLRLIAYEMQAGDAGLKGNLISTQRLIKVLTNYLRNQGFGEPRDKANSLIQQLRERNYILCYRGTDTYGFVHRTFLEYFCAAEIINRFQTQQSITFEQLRDDIFGLHWREETWHEVLQLVCGMLNEKFILELVNYLIAQDNVEKTHIHLLIASKCFSEIRNQSEARETYFELIDQIFHKRGGYSWSTIKSPNGIIAPIFHSNIAKALSIAFESWKQTSDTLTWIEEKKQTCIDTNEHTSGDVAALMIQKLSQLKTDSPDNFEFLEGCVRNSKNTIVRVASLSGLIHQYAHKYDFIPLLQDFALLNEEHFVRWISITEMSRLCPQDRRAGPFHSHRCPNVLGFQSISSL